MLKKRLRRTKKKSGTLLRSNDEMYKGINIVCNCPKNCEKNDRRIAFINEANRGGLIFLASLFSLLLLVQLSK